MAANSTTLKDEVISADAVVTAPRGRKKELNPELLATLRKVTPENGVVLGKAFGEVKTQKERQTVAASIRKHWKDIHGEDGPKSKIDFRPSDGVPQVRMKKTD